MKNFQNFKILQIADNMWLPQILSKFVFLFLEAQQDKDCGYMTVNICKSCMWTAV